MDRVLQFVLFACTAVVLFSVPTTSQSRFKPDIPEVCRKQGYCEKIPNYPKDHAMKLIAKLPEDLVKQIFQTETLDDTEIAQRDGEGLTVALCNITERIITPESLQDPEGTWWIVLQNNEKKITQQFRVGTCDTGASCSDFIEPRRGYRYECKQERSAQTVLVMDENGRVVQNPHLQLPSCCSCMITPKFLTL